MTREEELQLIETAIAQGRIHRITPAEVLAHDANNEIRFKFVHRRDGGLVKPVGTRKNKIREGVARAL